MRVKVDAATLAKLQKSGVVPQLEEPQQITLELPWPPSTNRIWRRVGNRTVLSKAARQYHQQVMRSTAVPVAMTGRLAVALVANPPDNRRRDIDNLIKTVLDALRKVGAYEDDSQIDLLTIIRGSQCDGGNAAVMVDSLTDGSKWLALARLAASKLTPAERLEMMGLLTHTEGQR